jgi:hypothetical protein
MCKPAVGLYDQCGYNMTVSKRLRFKAIHRG